VAGRFRQLNTHTDTQFRFVVVLSSLKLRAIEMLLGRGLLILVSWECSFHLNSLLREQWSTVETVSDQDTHEEAFWSLLEVVVQGRGKYFSTFPQHSCSIGSLPARIEGSRSSECGTRV
jgi:hypothetical protein